MTEPKTEPKPDRTLAEAKALSLTIRASFSRSAEGQQRTRGRGGIHDRRRCCPVEIKKAPAA
jgi:hypothetical protein